ncbi:SpoIIE family protein phosphatase [Clostridium sp. FP1]|uniref:SpoIIE family protein phosphatase n=1 Tax=Clostridium sp. FP1 TaxID=2724076 RepID=UPI0013E91673|nr:SpoIIE family protein phosphatase [Clostridium sp. FP1]MBZ9633419.1 serine/threonine-protein phosphatase [Clostridium sp. FP1]
MADIDLGMTYKALLCEESECGDIGIIKEYNNYCFLALIDILGHGSEAREVALYAKLYLENNYEKDSIDLMNGLHEHLKGTRGAVAAICNLNVLTGELSYVGIGNITVRIMGSRFTRLVPKDGVIGYIMAKPQKQILKLYEGDILLLHSDGIKEHFELFECAGLLKESAVDIAQGILKRFEKKQDDASCIVLKYLI